MMKAGKTVGVLALATAFAIAGCAKVDIKKVPTPTQYVHWTDAMQKKSDKMKGIRFYLPRPFINVFESFPIRTDIYIADGVVSPDGKYVLIKSVKPESGLNDYMAGIPSLTKIPSRYVTVPKQNEVERAVHTQSAAIEAAQKKAEQAARNSMPTGGSPQDSKDTTTPSSQPVTGINQRSVTNDNAAFAFQPLRGNFDIVYMPDFEEQYVISSFAGLGNAQFVLKLGQGWSLQGFNSLTDNSELNKRMYDLIDTAIKAAKTAVSAMGGMPLPALPAGITEMFKPQSGAVTLEGDEGKPNATPHTPVSLKIVVVHYAAKGLYPVIKPHELEERTVSTVKGSGAFNCFMDLFRSAPFFMSSSDYDPNAIHRAKLAVQNETGKFTVPVYPYQYISFNTFRYMAIEVIKTDTPPFGTLYDKTGTQGDAGEIRRNDVGSVPSTGTTTTSAANKIPDSLRNAWMNNLKNKRLSTDTNFKITNATYENEVLTVTIDVEGTPQNKPSLEQLNRQIRDVAIQEATLLNEKEPDMPKAPAIQEIKVNLTDNAGDYITSDDKKQEKVSAKDIEAAIASNPDECKIQSGTDAFFVITKPMYEDAGKLTVSIETNGNVSPQHTLDELKVAIKDAANNILAARKDIQKLNPVDSVEIREEEKLSKYLRK